MSIPTVSAWLAQWVTLIQMEHAAGHLTQRDVAVLLTMLVHQAAQRPIPTIRDLADEIGVSTSTILNARTHAIELGLIAAGGKFSGVTGRKDDLAAEQAIQGRTVLEFIQELQAGRFRTAG